MALDDPDHTTASQPPGLRIGYLLPTRDRVAAGHNELGPLIEQAQLAEALGLDSVWVGDSPLTRPRADALMVLAAVAAVTRRITLGTAVLLVALRHPILLAHQLATLDRIAEGRLIVGVGAGFPHTVTETQFAALGVSFKHRATRLEESIEAMRRLWTGEAVSFQSTHVDFHNVTLAPTPTRTAGPPIWMAGGGEPALRRVAKLADGWLPYPPTWTTYAHERAAIEHTATCVGRRTAITPALYATVCVDTEPERARQRLRASIERYYRAPLAVIEAIQATFAGSATDCAAWLSQYARAGARHIIVRLATDDHRAALEEFAHSVLPSLRTATAAESRP